MMALKALPSSVKLNVTGAECLCCHLDEPRKMQPKITTKAVVRINAFKGIACLSWTLEKNFENGRPPSLTLVSAVLGKI